MNLQIFREEVELEETKLRFRYSGLKISSSSSSTLDYPSYIIDIPTREDRKKGSKSLHRVLV